MLSERLHYKLSRMQSDIVGRLTTVLLCLLTRSNHENHLVSRQGPLGRRPRGRLRGMAGANAYQPTEPTLNLQARLVFDRSRNTVTRGSCAGIGDHFAV